MTEDRTQTSIAKHLPATGVAACAVVLSSFVVTPGTGVDASGRGRTGAIGATAVPAFDRTLLLLIDRDDEIDSGSRASSLHHQSRVNIVAAFGEPQPRSAFETSSTREVDVLMVAPKHDPPALLA